MGKYLSTILILVLFITSILPYPAQAQQVYKGVEVREATDTNGQVSGFTNGVNGTGKSSNNGFGSAAADAVGCGAGQILGGIVRNGVSGIVGSLTNKAVSSVVGVATTLTKVPVTDSIVQGHTEATRNLVSTETGKETGASNSSLAGSFSNLFSLPSWDAIGYCLANAAIHYVTQSTVNWINSGFKGSPAFVDNPEQFFTGIADQEAGGLIEELGLGFLCTEFSPKVRIALVNDYMKSTNGQSYKKRAACTMTNTVNNIDKISADFQKGDLSSYVEYVGNPANRAASSYLMAHDELNRRVSLNQGKANFELRMTDFLSFKKCDNVTGKDGKTSQANCRTYSPGQVIEGELNNALGAKYQRLAMADEFDEVVTALVNQLIKTALNEVLTPDDSSTNSNNKRTEKEKKEDNTRFENILVSNNIIPPTTTTTEDPVPGTTPTERVITATCTVDTVSTKVGQPVIFTARPRGGAVNQNYTYEWLDVPDATQNTTINQILTYFKEPTAASQMRVRVTSGGKRAIATCPSVSVAPPDPIIGSCAANPNSAKKSDTITWSATASGGTGIYSYAWSGENLDNKTGTTTTTTYDSKGSKSGFVEITSGIVSTDISCVDDVIIK